MDFWTSELNGQGLQHAKAMRKSIGVLLALVVVNLATVSYSRWAIHIHLLLLVALSILVMISPRLPQSLPKYPDDRTIALLADWIAHRWPFVVLAFLVNTYALLNESRIPTCVLSLFITMIVLFGAHVSMRQRRIWTNYGLFTADRNPVVFWLFVAILWSVYVLFLVLPLRDLPRCPEENSETLGSSLEITNSDHDEPTASL